MFIGSGEYCYSTDTTIFDSKAEAMFSMSVVECIADETQKKRLRSKALISFTAYNCV